MALHLNLNQTAVATALACLLAPMARAQTAPPSLAEVTVAAKSAPVLDTDSADVGALGLPLLKTPQSISVLGSDLLAATKTGTLSQAIKLDAALADSYNTTGYIESMSIRGFLLDQNSNYRRNGLSISNYAPLALENKDRIEILKGIAGLQSGVSTPGGLVNFVTKSPVPEPFHTVEWSADGNGGSKLHMDSNGAWGPVGVRTNVAAEDLASHFSQAGGRREFASLALAGSFTPDTRATIDLEYHHKQQISVPGLGLLDLNGDGIGESLPPRINPRLNLNQQPWSQPFNATSAIVQLGLSTRLATDWKVHMSLAVQRSEIDDRIAFPDGCSTASTYVYPGLCANGDVDVYDFRSEAEQRLSWGWEGRASRTLQALGRSHQLSLGLSGRGNQEDLAPLQAYNFSGTTNILKPVPLPADPTLTALNTNGRQRALDAFATLVTEVTPTVQAIGGFRTTSLARTSERSDGSNAVSIAQTVTTPWLAATWQAQEQSTLYASWGQGVELDVVPNRPQQFANYGAALPALKSEQLELGWKWLIHPRFSLSTALFAIEKPVADDLVGTGLVTRVVGRKTARHRGLELSLQGRVTPTLSVQSSLSILDARWASALDPTLVGQRVTNIPKVKASMFAEQKLLSLAGLSWHGLLTFEDGKTANAGGSTVLPATWQLDTGFRYTQRWSGHSVRWQFQIDNLTDRTFWREAPTQSWGGIYLFASTPRTLRASVAVDF